MAPAASAQGNMPATPLKRGDKAGWCVYYVNEHCVVALYGSWISGQRYEWVNKEKKEITPEIRREVEESRKRRDEEIKAEQGRVADAAAELYATLPEASDNFPYLVRKGIKNHGGILRYNEAGDYLGSYIAAPLFNPSGEIRSLERRRAWRQGLPLRGLCYRSEHL